MANTNSNLSTETVTPARVWTKEQILALLAARREAVELALVALYAHQTDDEQASHDTRWKNGVGFNAMDADFGSSLAKSYKRYGRLTDRQVNAARKMLRKYAGQLARIANAKEIERARERAAREAAIEVECDSDATWMVRKEG